jgi:hypothetical protein
MPTLNSFYYFYLSVQPPDDFCWLLGKARMQSGAGWDEKTCMIVAEKALWDNLEIVSFRFSILILGHKLHNKLRLIVSSHHSFAVLSKNWEIQEKWLSYV